METIQSPTLTKKTKRQVYTDNSNNLEAHKAKFGPFLFEFTPELHVIAKASLLLATSEFTDSAQKV